MKHNVATLKCMCVRVSQLRCAVCVSGTHVQPVDGSVQQILSFFNKYVGQLPIAISVDISTRFLVKSD